MGLPFIKPRNITSVIVSKQSPEGSIEASHEEGSHPEGFMQACADILRAIHAKDVNALADAFAAASHLADQEPHEEGAHEDEE